MKINKKIRFLLFCLIKPQTFSFMLQTQYLKYRTKFYECLSHILMQENSETLAKNFMRPFGETLETLHNVRDIQNRDVVLTGVGIARDLTGVLNALSQR